MTTITIREHGVLNPNWPVVCFDGQEFACQLPDLAPEEEGRLLWYFEEHYRQPFADGVKAQQAAASIFVYGERLFAGVFVDPDAYAEYRAATQAGLANLTVEIAGSPAFHARHWEALKDPKLAQPLALQVNFVRRNLTPQPIKARPAASPTVNVLLVTARPSGAGDVAYRTIARPLLDALGQASLRVQVDILRPGTYEALERQLRAVREQHPDGYYHVIHFDVHGGLLTHAQFEGLEQQGAAGLAGAHTFQLRRPGRGRLEPYEGRKAFLFLERAEAAAAGAAADLPDPVEASELAGLLQAFNIPIVILNACQSAMQWGAHETSLGSRLMAAGVQMVLAMSYSITVAAARLLMTEFYRALFGGADLGAAVRSARLQLYNHKARPAFYNFQIDLEDWLLPVVYENRPQTLQPRAFTAEEHAAFYAAEAARHPAPLTSYRFVGRDLDILEIERRLLARRNILLLRGMGGAGKTTLLQHLAWWWQRTGFVAQVFAFAYDQRAWNRQQIFDAIARKLWSEADYSRLFLPLALDAQAALLAERLRSTRHLLILDNLESVTGADLAVQHTLPPAEQDALHGFLRRLAGGRTLVLLGSRGPEGWLQGGTFEENIHVLGGLDPQAASELADLILQRHGATRHRRDGDLSKLIGLLDGYPLALEVVLANLAKQTPGEVLQALAGGAAGVDAAPIDLAGPDSERKTESILACIAYSHSNLAAAAQGLLLCLAPFTGVIYTPALEAYTQELQQQPALAHLPFDRWAEVLQAAQDWGLLAPHETPGFLRIQPTLPYFLRLRLHAQAETAAAVETAFYRLYDQFGRQIHGLITSKESRERQLGLALAGLEYENLHTALRLALAAHASVLNLYVVLSLHFDAAQDQQAGLQLSASVLAALEQYPSELLAGPLGLEFIGVIDDAAKRQLLLKQFSAAEQSYRRALVLFEASQALTEEQKKPGSASIYHQLGNVAQEQRQWAQAEAHYRQALALLVEFGDRYEQAGTYHQLGMVAQEQRQWAQAEAHYRQALALCIEFGDRYEQAGTYHQLGRVAQAGRQWAQAEAHYRQALALLVEFGDRYEQAGTYHQLGMVAQEQRQWAQAEAHYRQALALCIEFGDRYEQAGTYHQLGRVAQEQRQWAQAEAHYRQALALKIEFGDRYSQASTYGQLGLLAQEERQWAQAREHLLLALALFREYDDEHSMGVTLRNLARLWQESGDEGLPAAAAAVGGITPEEMEAWFQQVLAADEDTGGDAAAD